ncbi:MAG: NADP-dependent oxidoreductase [Spirosomataceae bacterium]
MKAYSLSKYSKKETLHLIDIPKPTIEDHEVLIEVHATSINQLDVKLKSGEFKLILPYSLPLILGHDVAGIITNVGVKVKRFNVGDAVFAFTSQVRIGTFAEYVAVSEAHVAHKPTTISMEEAASVPLVALTARQAFVENAELKKGQKVFIQAGSGGVGTFAIQLAKQIGATVATTTSLANFGLVSGLGADFVIDYKTQDFEKLLAEYDVVLNSQDEKTLEKSVRILKPGGKIISISGPPDVSFALKMNLSWWMRTIIHFLSRKIQIQTQKSKVSYSFLFVEPDGQALAEIGRLIEERSVQPIIDKVFPFEKINEAMAYVASGRAKGKVVVKVR